MMQVLPHKQSNLKCWEYAMSAKQNLLDALFIIHVFNFVGIIQ